ncbi:FHA domain-containing protein [Isosphaeraceae bacterium EP7]
MDRVEVPTVSEMSWALTVTKGRAPGTSYPLAPGETIVGAANGPGRRIDLSDQEAGARRLADSQASIQCEVGVVAVRDLESPAGTFVNRRRILPGRSHPLADGDLIDLGGVQVRFSRANGNVEIPRPSKSPREPFRFSGLTCNDWDDFATLSAQHWQGMVAEVETGRLSAYLLRHGQPPLPDRGSAAERLDFWLAGLPSAKAIKPELDVHPTSIVCGIEAGATIRRELTVSNVGYRLLRGSVELPGVPWLRLISGARSAPFIVAESSKVTLEISRPDGGTVPLMAELKVVSDGGESRVAIRVEGTGSSAKVVDSEHEPRVSMVPWLETLSPSALILVGASLGLLLRTLLWVGGSLLGQDRGLAGPAALGLGLGGLAGLVDGLRRQPASLPVSGTMAGAIVGAMAASLALAMSRVIEGPLAWGGPLVGLLAWAALGAAVAAWYASHRRNAVGRPD